jgi:hypothetical protein
LELTHQPLPECISAGCPGKKNGHYDLTECILWRIAEAGEKAAAADLTEEQRKWMAEYRKYKAQLAKLMLEKQRGKLMSIETVSTEWAKRLGYVMSGLDTLKDRMSVICEMKGRHEIFELIDTEVKRFREAYVANSVYCPTKETDESRNKTQKQAIDDSSGG